MPSPNEDNQALQQALATIAAQQKTIDAQQETIDAQGKSLEQHTKTIDEHTKTLQGHAKTLVAYQEHIINQGKKNDDLEQRIQQLEEALRKATTSSGGAKAKADKGKNGAAKSSKSVSSFEDNMAQVWKDLSLLKEYNDAYYDYYGMDKSDEAIDERMRASIEFYRSQGKGAGATKMASLTKQTKASRSRLPDKAGSNDGSAEDPRSASPWSRLSTASSSTMK